MADVQKLQTPLVESAIKVEPGTPPQQPIFSGIRRVWSMMFGRRDHILQPIYASPAGMLGVVNFDLEGWTLVYNADANENWTDMAVIVDLVLFGGINDANLTPYMEFGPATGTVQYAVLPTNIAKGFDAAGTRISSTGFLHARVRWFKGTEIFGVSGRVMGYIAPKR